MAGCCRAGASRCRHVIRITNENIDSITNENMDKIIAIHSVTHGNALGDLTDLPRRKFLKMQIFFAVPVVESADSFFHSVEMVPRARRAEESEECWQPLLHHNACQRTLAVWLSFHLWMGCDQLTGPNTVHIPSRTLVFNWIACSGPASVQIGNKGSGEWIVASGRKRTTIPGRQLLQGVRAVSRWVFFKRTDQCIITVYIYMYLYYSVFACCFHSIHKISAHVQE